RAGRLVDHRPRIRLRHDPSRNYDGPRWTVHRPRKAVSLRGLLHGPGPWNGLALRYRHRSVLTAIRRLRIIDRHGVRGDLLVGLGEVATEKNGPRLLRFALLVASFEKSPQLLVVAAEREGNSTGFPRCLEVLDDGRGRVVSDERFGPLRYPVDESHL